MSLQQELQDVRDAVEHLLKFGQPKSETHANELIAAMNANVGAGDEATPNATDAAKAHADATGVDISQVQGTGQGGQVTKSDVEQAADAQQSQQSQQQAPS